MTTKATGKRAKSPIQASVHETAAGLHRIGLVGKMTMREFDALCLAAAEPLAPEEIRALREREKVSPRVALGATNLVR